jgi:multiple sugar transport system ATP-binding protein
MPALELDGVEKSFGGVAVLHGIDISVGVGEHLAMLGPSGSGKSTLLRMIAGLDHPDVGVIRIQGDDQAGVPAHRRDVALVFQQYALYPHLTARKNITMGLVHGLGLSRRDADQRADGVLETLSMTPLAARRPAQLSGGQRQRIALGRALARRAGIVLLDEPLSGLDAQLRLEIRGEMNLLLRREGATVVHVTHDQGDAMAGADRIAVLEGGRLRQLGTPLELYREPADIFTARFLGAPPMTILPLQRGDGLRSAFGAHRAAPGIDPAWIGIRPEHLRLGGGGPWRASGTVTGVELTGADSIVYLDIDGAVGAARVSGEPPLPGAVVALGADPGQAHLFGTDERRLGDGALLEATPLSTQGKETS